MTEPRNIILERLNQISQAIADLAESHATFAHLLMQMNDRLASMDATLSTLGKDVRDQFEDNG